MLHRIPVNRLEGEHIDHSRADSLPGQLIGRLQRLGHAHAGGHKGHISTGAQLSRLPNFKGGARLVNLHRVLPGQADIIYAVGPLQLANHIVQHDGVGGLDNGHSRDIPQGAHVLKGHVGGAIHGRSDTGIAADDADVGFGKGGRHKNLV